MPLTGESLLSSPDPLALSNENIPTPSPTKFRKPVTTPRKPLRDASGNSYIHEFNISTPPVQRSGHRQTESPKQSGPTSPWRIRLTVQAEQIEDHHGVQHEKHTPKTRLTERTTTITVPLKDGDDTPPNIEKKGRGRPRKSLDSPQKRNGTPKPTSARKVKLTSRTRKEQDDDAGNSRTTPPKKARGRPRKGMEPNADIPISVESDSSIRISGMVAVDSTSATGKPICARSKGRRKEITPIKIALDSDTESLHGRDSTGEGKALAPIVNPDEGANRALLNPESQDLSNLGTLQDREGSHPEPPRVESVTEAQDCYSSSVRERFTSSSRGIHEESEKQTETDPTDSHQEYDTILESEGFSMVSVSSLASTDSHTNSADEYKSRFSNQEHTPTIKSSPLAPPAPQNDVSHLSTRQLNRQQDGTPKLVRVVRAGIALQGVLSPRDQRKRLSSPLQGPQNATLPLPVSHTSNQLDNSSSECKINSPKERLDDLFNGFGAGTRRELRAGLRIGEELAKRQRPVSGTPAAASEPGDDVFYSSAGTETPGLSPIQQDYILKVPRPGHEAQNKVLYPTLPRIQLPTPERSEGDTEEDGMSWKEATPDNLDDRKAATPDCSGDTEVLISPLIAEVPTTDSEASLIDYTMMARQAEWQREREAISRQIEMANKSQVIVIDSDSEDIVEDEEQEDPDQDWNHDRDYSLDDEDDVNDIWQVEALSIESSRDSTPEVSDAPLQPDMIKPRRSKLPSPWRRSSQVIYSDDIERTESDLFWQPDHAKRKTQTLRIENAREVETHEQTEPLQTEYSESLDQEFDQSSYLPDDSTGALIADQLNTARTSNKGTTTPIPIPEIYPTENFSNRLNNNRVKEPEKQTLGRNISPSNSGTKYEEDYRDLQNNHDDCSPLSSKLSLEDQEGSLPIDPLLLQPQKPSQKTNANRGHVTHHRRPIQFESVHQASWLSSLTAPIYQLITPSTPLPPPATKSDILNTSRYEPLCQLTPWTPCHNRALGPLYYGSLLYGAHIFRYNPSSPSAAYLGRTVITRLDWKRKITKADCSVTDAFMILLKDRGYVSGESTGQWIDEAFVVKMCVALWVGMIMRGEVDADALKGEVVGLRAQGDRAWTKADVKWEENGTEYFERKRKEFQGLASWKELGIKWP